MGKLCWVGDKKIHENSPIGIIRIYDKKSPHPYTSRGANWKLARQVKLSEIKDKIIIDCEVKP